MTTFTEDLNEGAGGILTAAEYSADLGDGATGGWFFWIKSKILGERADAAVEGGATAGTVVALLKGLQKAIGINTTASTPTGDGYVIPLLKAIRDNARTGTPGDATRSNGSSGNVANASAAASIPATSAKTGYLTGIEFTATGATAASNVVATITGLLGGTISFIVAVPAGVNTQVSPIILQFQRPLPASAVNTAITLTVPALGAGNTHCVANIHGYII